MKIPCVVENYDSILKMRRPNGSSATWYLKEEKELKIPGNFADMHFFNNKNILKESYERTRYDEITTDDYKGIIPEDKLDQVKYAINKLSTCIKYITLSDLLTDEYKDTHYFYIISMWNGDFWQRHANIGFECIHDRVKKDIRDLKCTLIFEYTAEPHSWNGQDMFELLETWRIKENFPPNSLYFLSGDLLADKNVIKKKFGYIAKGFSTFEGSLKPIKGVPKYNPTDKANLFLNYNRRPRVHRFLFLYHMFKLGIEDRGLFSYAGETFNDEDFYIKNNRLYYKSATNPFGSFDFLSEIDETIAKKIDKNEFNIGNQDLTDNLALTPYINEDYSSTFLSVVNETNTDKDILFLSEKIWKPIMLEHPFIVIGNPGTLRALKSMGYRTFNKYWDESYDDTEDVTLRIQAVADIIYKLSKKSTKELKDLRKDMQDILTYNRANFNVTKNQYFLGRNDVLPLGTYLEELYKEKVNEQKTII